MKEMKWGMGKMRVRFSDEGKKWRLTNLLNADDLVLCGDSEEDLRMMMGRFVEVHKRRGLKVNVDKSKVTVLVVERMSLS